MNILYKYLFRSYISILFMYSKYIYFFSILVFLIILHQEVIHAQEVTASDRPVLNPLALGGMVQGLLGMQVSV